MNVGSSIPLTVLSFQAEDFVEASGRISLLPEELPSARFVFYVNHLQTAILSCTLYVYFSSQSALLFFSHFSVKVYTRVAGISFEMF